MISRTEVVYNKQWNPQTVEWREATAQMNKTPDTMKMDLRQNILEKSLLIFSEAKASWVCTLLPTKLHQTAKNLESFSSSFLFLEKPSSLYVSNSTFPSPQKKTTNTIESSHSRAG